MPNTVINYIYSNAEIIIAFFYVCMSVGVTGHAILYKRDTKSVIAWVGLAWLSPFIGALSYYVFGINRIQRRAVSLSIRKAWRAAGKLELTDEETAQKDALLAHPQAGSMILLSRYLSTRMIQPGNTIVPLVNGDEAFPAMLEAIGGARKSISLLSYIFDHDSVGRQFVEALCQAQARGVDVRVLVDGVGVRYGPRPNIVKALRKADIRAAAFLPTRVPRLRGTANLRNHRKIMVVDGSHGFTGGTNIRANHCLNSGLKHPAQCLHFSLEGPVIHHLQQTFAVDWAFATGESLHGEDWFPSSERSGETWARGISHGPDEDFEHLGDLMTGALSMARTSVQIVTPYFLPPQTLQQVLGVTAMRGVRVDILIPGKSNIPIMDWATMAELSPLLSKGCNIYRTAAPFDHTKLMLVDDTWSLIGSTNWDSRSLRLNFEFNVECYDRELAAQLRGIVAEKLRNAHKMSHAEVRSRSLPAKFRDGSARLFGPYL